MFAALLFLHGIRWCGIGMTFDDGPVQKSFQLVEYLVQENIPAMFFPSGPNLVLHKNFVQFAVERGFSFGNHTFDHAEMHTASQKHIVWTIQRQHSLLIEQGASTPRWFRYPSGARSRRVTKTLIDLQYEGIADWDVFSGDIFGKPPEHAFKLLLRVSSSHNSAIVLFHDCNAGVISKTKKFVSLVKQHNKDVDLVRDPRIFVFVRPETILPGSDRNEFDY